MNAKEFLLALPEKSNKDVLEGHNTRFHFILSGDEGGEVTMAIEDGVLTAKEGLEGEPTCVVKSTAENLAKLIKKDLNPMMALLTGKLKISNQSEMLKYAKILGLM
jgi:putative sterol carrier protein